MKLVHYSERNESKVQTLEEQSQIGTVEGTATVEGDGTIQRETLTKQLDSHNSIEKISSNMQSKPSMVNIIENNQVDTEPVEKIDSEPVQHMVIEPSPEGQSVQDAEIFDATSA